LVDSRIHLCGLWGARRNAILLTTVLAEQLPGRSHPVHGGRIQPLGVWYSAGRRQSAPTVKHAQHSSPGGGVLGVRRRTGSEIR
jgi:hypothetical protein